MYISYRFFCRLSKTSSDQNPPSDMNHEILIIFLGILTFHGFWNKIPEYYITINRYRRCHSPLTKKIPPNQTQGFFNHATLSKQRWHCGAQQLCFAHLTLWAYHLRLRWPRCLHLRHRTEVSCTGHVVSFRWFFLRVRWFVVYFLFGDGNGWDKGGGEKDRW